MFITAKVEDEEGSIVQVVFAHFMPAQKDLCVSTLLPLATPLVSFIYHADTIKYGFISNDDFPHCMDEENKQVINSRYKMLIFCYKRVLVDGLFMPLSKFKHIIQFQYNKVKVKWGLDKCKDHYLKTKVQIKVMGLEGKYALRMFSGLAVANSW